MHSKLAGQLSLHDMITSVLQDTREKVASDEEKEKSEKSEKMKKLMKPEKKGSEEEKEKKSSVIDPEDPEQVEKLASALEVMADLLEKEASTYLGGESAQGGETLPVMGAVGGKQSNKKDSSKSHNVPMSTPEQSGDGGGPAKTQVENDHKSGKLLKYLHSKYPEKGVLKTAAGSVKEMIEAKKMDKSKDEGESKKEEKGEKKENPFAKKEGKDDDKEKKSSAVSFIVSKLAEYHGGGETLDSKAESGPKPAKGAKGGNSARKHISSAQAAIDMKKVDGKEPQKRMLAEVLTEPAQSKAHDSKVHENLRNASKGGVKIAAAKAFLSKIAGDANDPRHEKLKEAMKKMEKKSLGGMGGAGGAKMPAAAPAMTTPPMTGGMR